MKGGITMKTIRVNVTRPYTIFVGNKLLATVGDHCREVNAGTRALIVSDSNVSPLYAQQVTASLQSAGYDTELFVFSAGEENKRLSVISGIYAALASNGFTRRDLLVALGGGVTGDMTGFAAATWLRGIDYVQIPTTLLAQVDSSIGGKTGVDIPEGKNLVGAFWQPACVIADIDTLSTLPPVTFADGMAEVIKTACIKDLALFESLETGEAIQPEHLEDTIVACIQIKKTVVEHDETEAGERKLLNFGHTMGHALEHFYNYHTLTHGRAVALGMVLITEASERLALTSSGTTLRMMNVLEQYHLPIADTATLDDYLPSVGMDKKRSGSSIDLALLHTIGDSFIYRIPLSLLGGFLRGEEF